MQFDFQCKFNERESIAYTSNPLRFDSAIGDKESVLIGPVSEVADEGG